jgi:hypothetical protein
MSSVSVATNKAKKDVKNDVKKDAKKRKTDGPGTDPSPSNLKIFCPNPGCDRHEDAAEPWEFKIAHHRDMHLITCRFNPNPGHNSSATPDNTTSNNRTNQGPDHGHGSSMVVDSAKVSVAPVSVAASDGAMVAENGTQMDSNAKGGNAELQPRRPAKRARISASQVTDEFAAAGSAGERNYHKQTLDSLRAKLAQYRQDMMVAEEEFKLRREKVEKVESVISYLEADL